MTRVNVVDVELLADQHLMAELRELKHIVPSLRRSQKSKNWPRALPEEYTLGQGHVSFWYNKLGYIQHRYQLVHAELIKRQYSIQFSELDMDVCQCYKGMYTPTLTAKQINVQRIVERISKKPQWYKWKHQPLPVNYLQILEESCKK